MTASDRAAEVLPPSRSRKREYLSLAQRFIALLVYLPLLYVFQGSVTGRWTLELDSSGLWLVSAIGFLAYSLFDTPFFVSPSEAISNGISAGLVLLAISLPEAPALTPAVEAIRWLGFGVAVVAVISAAAASVPFHRRVSPGKWSQLAYHVAKRLGHGRLLFTPPALISIVTYHQDSPADILWLIFGWAALLARPVEFMWGTLQQFRRSNEPAADAAAGTIDRIDSPNIVRVALADSQGWQRQTAHVACLPDGRQVNLVPLSVQTRGDSFLGTGLIVGQPEAPIAHATPGMVYRSSPSPDGKQLLCRLSAAQEADLVGFAVEESKIASIRFEVTTEVPLREGMLVFCCQGEQRVYYQILDATTSEESFERNPYGAHRAIAAQLGILDADKGFVKYPWLPDMNAPVFLAQVEPPTIEPNEDELVLGTVPDTRIPVRARFSELLEFHTSVLGVTGTGKTEFVFDIIRHGLKTGAKVFCVDLTEEYSSRLAESKPDRLGFTAEEMQTLESHMFEIETGKYKGEEGKKALASWMDQIRPTIDRRVADFLRSEGGALGVFELPEIANTRATLQATELYLSAVFAWARRNRRARRILVVLEEAHTVIPETAFFGFDKSETHAVVGRMAQIALQGRKYGVGLLLISQRTALVSKTLLSQCNTCFSFAMYDRTGLEYLSTIYGAEHVGAVPNLGFLECIGFGKAVLSDRPILFEIPFDKAKKDASDALRRPLVQAVEDPVEPEVAEIEQAGDAVDPWEATGPSTDDDDIPF